MATKQDIFTQESIENPSIVAERWQKITKLSEAGLGPDMFMDQGEALEEIKKEEPIQ